MWGFSVFPNWKELSILVDSLLNDRGQILDGSDILFAFQDIWLAFKNI